MECPFVVGDLVALKDGIPPPDKPWGEIIPVHGMVYTVREVGLFDDVVGIRLVEIINKSRQYRNRYGESAFAAWVFRKVTTPDISVFNSMLVPQLDEVNI